MIDNPKASPGPPLVCRLQIPLTAGQGLFHGISAKFPGAVFAISSYQRDPRGMILVFRVTAPADLDRILIAVQSHELVTSYEFLGKTGRTATVLVTVRTPEGHITTVTSSLELLPLLPIYVKQGVMTLIIAAPAPKVRTFIRQMRGRFPDMLVTSMRNAFLDIPEHLMSPSQHNIYLTAVTSGYWDVPRRTSNTDLATLYHMSKSTIIDVLGGIEEQLIYGSGNPPFLRLRPD